MTSGDGSQRIYDCIVIGAGIAGLSAARKLLEAGKDIAVISPEIGGRVVRGKNGVNYGAYFCSRSYRNLLPFLDLKEPLRFKDMRIHRTGRTYGMFSLTALPVLPELMRIYPHMIRSSIHFSRMRRAALEIGQKRAIEADPYLHKLFLMSAGDWFRDHGFDELVRTVLDEAAYGMSFDSAGNHNAFHMMQWASELLCFRLFKIDMDMSAFAQPVNKHILNGRVSNIALGDTIRVSYGGGEIASKALIIATEPWELGKMLDGSRIPEFASSHMWHISGKLKPPYSDGGSYQLFEPSSPVAAITSESDGTHLIYARHSGIDLGHYFENASVIAERSWDPAICLKSEALSDEEVAENVFQSTSLNIEGLEDAFINGAYCAKRVIGYLDKPAT